MLRLLAMQAQSLSGFPVEIVEEEDARQETGTKKSKWQVEAAETLNAIIISAARMCT
jgi:hypothetical protein